MNQSARGLPAPITPEQFKLGMRDLAGSVNIITAAHAGHRYGMTATAACSATAEPPTVLVCIRKGATAHDAVVKSNAYCLNVLRAESWELAMAFGGRQSGEGRFKSHTWICLATGSPALNGALVSFDCRVVKRMSHGTHTVFLGQVEQMLVGKQGKPLLYADGQYGKLASLAYGEPLPEGLDYWGI